MQHSCEYFLVYYVGLFCTGKWYGVHRVGVGVYLLNVADINLQAGSFYVDFVLTMFTETWSFPTVRACVRACVRTYVRAWYGIEIWLTTATNYLSFALLYFVLLCLCVGIYVFAIMIHPLLCLPSPPPPLHRRCQSKIQSMPKRCARLALQQRSNAHANAAPMSLLQSLLGQCRW